MRHDFKQGLGELANNRSANQSRRHGGAA